MPYFIHMLAKTNFYLNVSRSPNLVETWMPDNQSYDCLTVDFEWCFLLSTIDIFLFMNKKKEGKCQDYLRLCISARRKFSKQLHHLARNKNKLRLFLFELTRKNSNSHWNSMWPNNSLFHAASLDNILAKQKTFFTWFILTR